MWVYNITKDEDNEEIVRKAARSVLKDIAEKNSE